MISGSLVRTTNFVYTKDGAAGWINLEFEMVEKISKIVINLIEEVGSSMVDQKLTIIMGGVLTFNHTIAQADLTAGAGKLLTLIPA